MILKMAHWSYNKINIFTLKQVLLSKHIQDWKPADFDFSCSFQSIQTYTFPFSYTPEIFIQSLGLTLCYDGSIATLFFNLEIWCLCFRHRRSGFWISGLTLTPPLPSNEHFPVSSLKNYFQFKCLPVLSLSPPSLNLGPLVESVRPLPPYFPNYISHYYSSIQY